MSRWYPVPFVWAPQCAGDHGGEAISPVRDAASRLGEAVHPVRDVPALQSLAELRHRRGEVNSEYAGQECPLMAIDKRLATAAKIFSTPAHNLRIDLTLRKHPHRRVGQRRLPWRQ